MTRRIAQSKFFGRLFDILTPGASWLIITLPLWLSPFHPALVAYFIVAFDLYFFYKAIRTAYFAVLSYRTIQFYRKIPFAQKLSRMSYKNICHFVIIPNYKEPLHKLSSTINALTQNDYPNANLNLVLAFEDREAEAWGKATSLTKQFKRKFTNILTTYHPLLPNEVAGKASNQTYAAKIVDKFLTKKKIKSENVLITVCDADSLLPKNYFSYLTYEYLRDPDRTHHFYWAPVLLYSNFWQLPFFVRMQATLSSILRLAFLSQKDELIQISTYSTSLWLLREVDFWDVDIIPEDWHIYLQAFFKFGKKTKTLPLYTIINGDAVYSGALMRTLRSRYEQEKRWAGGVSDIAYALKKFFITPRIRPMDKIRKIFFLLETHLLWPTSFFILTLSGFIPTIINPLFKRTVLGFILPRLTSFILTISSLMLILYAYIDIKLRHKTTNQKTQLKNMPMLFIQWYLLPVVSLVLSALPALEAHTRIILGKKLQYKVTEKV